MYQDRSHPQGANRLLETAEKEEGEIHRERGKTAADILMRADTAVYLPPCHRVEGG